jgi:hypothetical protein
MPVDPSRQRLVAVGRLRFRQCGRVRWAYSTIIDEAGSDKVSPSASELERLQLLEGRSALSEAEAVIEEGN